MPLRRSMRIPNNKIILDKKKCIDNCTNDNLFKFEFNNICYKECPKYSYSNPNYNFLCLC